MKKREKQEVIPRAKGKKRLSLKLRRGERPGLHSKEEKEKGLSITSKEGKGQAESRRGREGKNKVREKKEVQCVNREPAE